VNKKSVIVIATCTALGLVVGYVIFGKFAGHYVSLKTLLSFGGNAFQNAFNSLSGIEAIRNKILLSGAAGAAVGIALAFNLKK
jgi:hypothetical protein